MDRPGAAGVFWKAPEGCPHKASLVGLEDLAGARMGQGGLGPEPPSPAGAALYGLPRAESTAGVVPAGLSRVSKMHILSPKQVWHSYGPSLSTSHQGWGATGQTRGMRQRLRPGRNPPGLLA